MLGWTPYSLDHSALSETYLKAKRYAVFFAAVLALTSAVGLKPSDEGNLIGWSISNPENTRYVLYIVVLYYTSQLALFWDAQGKSIRELAQHAFDFWLSLIIALTALWSLPIALVVKRWGPHPNSANDWLIIGTLFVAPAIAIAGYRYIFRPTIRRSRDAAAERETEVLGVLTNFSWLFVYNATSYDQTKGAHGAKEMVFRPNGEIAIGKNINESAWRINAGYLEILDQHGAIYSRFTYDPQKERFVHTNDEDLRSLRNQYILKRERLYQT